MTITALANFYWMLNVLKNQYCFYVVKSLSFFKQIIKIRYRVSHIEMDRVNWLRQMDNLRFSISNLRWPVQEVMAFGFYQPVFKKSNIGWPQQPPTEKMSDISEKSDF